MNWYSKWVPRSGPQKSSNVRASRSAEPPCPVGTITRMLSDGNLSAAKPNGTCERAAAPRAPRKRRRRILECVIRFSSSRCCAPIITSGAGHGNEEEQVSASRNGGSSYLPAVRSRGREDFRWRSVELDVALLHELLHVRDLVVDLRLELLGRVAHGTRADLLELRTQRRIGHDLLHRRGEAREHGRRHLARRKQAVPRLVGESLETGLLHRHHVVAGNAVRRDHADRA